MVPERDMREDVGMHCESCGDDSGDLAAVQRIYMVDGKDGGPANVLDDIEQWCFPCRSLYPHRTVVESDEGASEPP